MIAEYKKKLENDRPILNLVVIGEYCMCYIEFTWGLYLLLLNVLLLLSRMDGIEPVGARASSYYFSIKSKCAYLPI